MLLVFTLNYIIFYIKINTKYKKYIKTYIIDLLESLIYTLMLKY